MKLQDKIKNHVEKHNIEYKEIAKQSNTSTSTLSKFLNEKNEIDFYSALRIVRYMFSDQETEIIKEYILTMQKPENLRCAMEYASFHGLTDLSSKIIKQELESKNAVNREWASIYDIDLKFHTGIIDPKTMISMIKNTSIKSVDLQVFKKYLEIKGHYSEYNFQFLPYLMFGMSSDLISNDFLKIYYQTRISLAAMNVYMFNDDVENSRANALIVIENNIDKVKTSYAYHALGLTYLYEDYEKSIYNLKKSLECVIGNSGLVRNVNNSITFVSNYWNKGILIEGETIEQKHEIIHYYITQNQNEKALKLLSDIDIKTLSKSQKGFYYYFRGICTNNIDDLYQSLNQFNIFGNKFYAKLPAIELLKRNERKTAIETALGKEIHYIK